jgi:Na+/H+ antiporter NhaD/arsenite permease-like protein
MVWQAGYVEFTQFFKLFLPSLVNFVIPSFIMSFFIKGSAKDVENPPVILKRGAIVISVLFLVTIMMAISFKNFLNLPPVFGMMFGLSLLQIFGYYLKRSYSSASRITRDGSDQPFGVFKQIAQAEWDTLLFFYGVIMCVAGLSKIGYLALLNTTLYDGLGFTMANSLMGIISALIDNIPVMFSVIQMHDTTTMDLNQWLLITLTAGVGGSLLSIGSAPGVALMGQAKGIYTFSSHLRWTGVIFIGYVMSILTHLWLSGLL